MEISKLYTLPSLISLSLLIMTPQASPLKLYLQPPPCLIWLSWVRQLTTNDGGLIPASPKIAFLKRTKCQPSPMRPPSQLIITTSSNQRLRTVCSHAYFACLIYFGGIGTKFDQLSDNDLHVKLNWRWIDNNSLQ